MNRIFPVFFTKYPINHWQDIICRKSCSQALTLSSLIATFDVFNGNPALLVTSIHPSILHVLFDPKDLELIPADWAESDGQITVFTLTTPLKSAPPDIFGRVGELRHAGSMFTGEQWSKQTETELLLTEKFHQIYKCRGSGWCCCSRCIAVVGIAEVLCVNEGQKLRWSGRKVNHQKFMFLFFLNLNIWLWKQLSCGGKSYLSQQDSFLQLSLRYHLCEENKEIITFK